MTCRRQIEYWLREMSEEVAVDGDMCLGWNLCILLMKECCDLIQFRYGYGF